MNYLTTDTDLTAVADAIRTKGGTSAALSFPTGFVDAIDAIETGGGGITVDDLATNAQPSGIVTLSDSITTIVDHAFQGKPITAIYGPGVTGIGMEALNQTRITSLTDENFPKLGVVSMYRVLLRLPSTCKSIKLTGDKVALSDGSHPLRYNTGLVTAEFPNAARSVGASYTAANQYCFGGCTNLTLADCGYIHSISGNAFNGAKKLATVVLRYTNLVTLGSVGAFTGTPFVSGGAGGTIYIPKSLYDELGTGSSSDYKAATNWSSVDGRGTITWAQIEGSEYEL